jgi:hypothetical protein
LAGEKTVDRNWPVDVSKLKAFEVSEIWARYTFTACIYDHHQAIGPVAIKGEAHKG